MKAHPSQVKLIAALGRLTDDTGRLVPEKIVIAEARSLGLRSSTDEIRKYAHDCPGISVRTKKGIDGFLFRLNTDGQPMWGALKDIIVGLKDVYDWENMP